MSNYISREDALKKVAHIDFIEKWKKEKWTVGQYTPGPVFKAVKNHSCICRKDGLVVIAVTGSAEDIESQKLADLFSAAPEMLGCLKRLKACLEKENIKLDFYSNMSIDKVIAKAEGRESSPDAAHTCAICGINWVDAEGGFDTCDQCERSA